MLLPTSCTVVYMCYNRLAEMSHSV